MKTVKELWNDLFDSSLESYKNEDETIRNLSMILHILKMEYEKTSQFIVELKRKGELQLKEISESKENVRKNNNRTPLKILTGNVNVLEATPKKNNTSYDIFDHEDLFNHQISELDVNLSKGDDDSLFVDNSVEDFEMSTSPTLNKHKNKRLSRAKMIKKEDIKNSSLKDLVIMNTPTPKINRSKKFKQTKLTKSSMINTTNQKNCAVTRNETTAASKSRDNDETLFLTVEPKTNNFPSDTEVLELLEDLKESASTKTKRIKLENSFDCFPVRENDSPEFAYKREAVRKKSERMKLQGWDCPECEKYYASHKHGLSDEELKKKMDQCSRHRNKFNPNILTPAGFWNPDFSPTQDSIAFNIE